MRSKPSSPTPPGRGTLAVLNTFHAPLGDAITRDEDIADPLGPARCSGRDVSDLVDQLKGLHRLV